ncbi:MAG TPA: clostripain-related cysteine peptidase [Nocardioides sp.]|uniref:clostripain-related cysteine peptidase n=1 Tax=Nocardioides sp. TaxID=35761 RepID=UPI002E2F22B3|nr:clostripain-related cysteine peptidase [Nocardioides sp.]HEX5090783.1 clostripain-related cysteine peptidase [Nocardioides sp.]
MSAGRRLWAALVAGAACLTAGALVAASAAAAPRVVAASAGADDTGADWTLMIYDVADTVNIADEMIRNLAAFAALPPMANVNVVALVDLPEQSDPGYPRATLPGVAPFTTAKLLVLGDNKWNEVRDLGEVSMGRPSVLSGFIEEAADRFPADKYGLVLSDHGSGVAGGYYDTGPPGQAHLSIAAMREGILTGLQAAGIDRFEVIDHDACLMSNYEVASALAPFAKAMAGSEEVTFGDATLSTDAILALGQGVSGAEWGRINNEAYGRYADGGPQGWGNFTAASVVDGDAMARLDAAVQSFADAASAHMAQIAPEVGRARTAALEFVKGLDPEVGPQDLVDLGDFLRHLQDVPDDVAVARDAVFAALDQAVETQVTRQATQQATGLSVYFPKFTTFAQQYVDQHIGPPGWEEFVSSYLAQTGAATGQQDHSAHFTTPDATILEQGPDGILVAGQLGDGQSANVTGAETQVFTSIAGRQTLVIDLPGYLDAGGRDQVQGAWSYQVTAVGNGGGGRGLPVSSIYQAQSGGLIGTFYASYTAADGQTTDVQFRLLLSSRGEIQGVTVSQAGTGGSAPVTLDGGRLTPYYIVPTDQSFDLEPADQSVQVTEDFQISFPGLKPGTPFQMGVVVTDVAGSVDGAFTTSTVQGGGSQGRSSLKVQ